MEPETEEELMARELKAINLLWEAFYPVGDFRFKHRKTKLTYDLSAADLTQIDYIVKEGLCID